MGGCCGNNTQGSQLKPFINQFIQQITQYDKKIQKLDNSIVLGKRRMMLKPDPQTKKKLLEQLTQDTLSRKKYEQTRNFIRKQLANLTENRQTIQKVRIIQASNKANSGVGPALQVAAIEQTQYQKIQIKATELKQMMDEIQGMNQQGLEFDQQFKAFQAEFADPK